jgi:beta-N-acetylhexosaminidase
LREELGFEGVILSDDLEMKAVSARIEVPSAATHAIRAGCDGVLICSGDVDVQAATLEALVKAVESGEIGATRLDNAFKRLRTAKERFLTSERPQTATRVRELKNVLGHEDHQAIAAEMASFL